MSFQSRPKYLIAFDIEDDGRGNPKIFNFFDGFEHFTFYSREDALAWIVRLSIESRQTVQFWSCNLSYDFAHLFNGYFRLTSICYVSSRVIYAKINGTNFMFYDTLNHWKMSVKKMGERIGLSKLDHGGNFVNVRYCRRDTEIVWWFVLQMSVIYDSFGAEIRATIGSSALALFKKQNDVHKFKFELSKSTIEWMLGGYYGGRTEVFYTKPVSGVVQYFDFNSLYPSTMLRDFPDIYSMRFVRKPNLDFEGMCDCTLEVPDSETIPLLPFRVDTKLVFPVGRFRGTFTYPEIRKAIEVGYRVIRLHRGFETRGKVRPFTDYVEGLYRKRLKAQEEGDDLMSEAFKLFMNNLYGKMAQGNEITELIPIEKAPSHSEVFGDMALHKKVGDYPDQTNVVWPAYVTTYGRIMVWDALKHIEKNSGLLLYCDTDSVMFESDKILFSDSKELGKLKLEGVFNYAWFKGPKMYRLVSDQKTFTKVKGVPRDVADTFFDSGKATFRRPYRLRECLRRNHSASKKKLIINYWDEFTKEHHGKYDKRIVLKNGHTKPLRVGRLKKFEGKTKVHLKSNGLLSGTKGPEKRMR